MAVALLLAAPAAPALAGPLQTAVGDVTCDGRPDVVLGLFDPATPRFALRVLSQGGGAGLFLPYDDSTFALCDASRPPELRLFTMPEAEVPVFTPEAVCPHAVGVWDRRCIPITVFWRRHPAPGQDRLLPAIN